MNEGHVSPFFGIDEEEDNCGYAKPCSKVHSKIKPSPRTLRVAAQFRPKTRCIPFKMQYCEQVLKSRKEYSTLYEKLEEAGATSATPPSKRNKSPLNEDEQRRLDVLEEELPLHSILMFRTMTRHKVQEASHCALRVCAV